MKDWMKYRTDEPTSTGEIVIECHADKRLLSPEFNDMPKDMQNLFKGEGRISLPCSGGGCVGVWCNECVFGEVVDD